MERIAVRRAASEDCPRLLELYGQLYALLRGMGVPFDLDMDGLNSLLGVMLKSKMCYLAVAETQEAKVCGFICVTVSRMDRKLRYGQSRLAAKVNDICVDKEFQGRNVASMLLEAAEAWLRDMGVSICESEVALENEASLRFFRKQGYQPFCYLTYKDI